MMDAVPDSADGEQSGPKCLNLSNVVKMGLSFLLIFAAYISVQNLMPQVLKDMGFDSLGFILVAVVYVAFLLFCTVSAVVLQSVSEKKVLVLSSVGYATFVAAFLLPVACPDCASALIAGVLVFAAAVSGICAAFLWVGQGAVMTFNSPQALVNTYQSIFQACFQAAQPIGSGISYFLVDTPELFFSVFTVISVAGTALLFTMREPTQHPTVPERKTEKLSFREALEPMARFVRNDVRARCIMSFSILAGIFFNIVPGCVLPMFVSSTQQLAKVQLMHGCASLAAGLSFSRLANTLGRRACLIISLVLWTVCLVLMWISGCADAGEEGFDEGQCESAWVMVAAAAAGFASGTTFTNNGACIVSAVHDCSHAGFGLLQASQSAATATLFPLLPQASPLVSSIVMAASMVLFGGYLLCHPTFFVDLVLHPKEEFSSSNPEEGDCIESEKAKAAILTGRNLEAAELEKAIGACEGSQQEDLNLDFSDGSSPKAVKSTSRLCAAMQCFPRFM